MVLLAIITHCTLTCMHMHPLSSGIDRHLFCTVFQSTQCAEHRLPVSPPEKVQQAPHRPVLSLHCTGRTVLRAEIHCDPQCHTGPDPKAAPAVQLDRPLDCNHHLSPLRSDQAAAMLHFPCFLTSLRLPFALLSLCRQLFWHLRCAWACPPARQCPCGCPSAG